MNNVIKMTIVKKGDKIYHNFYLFGVLVNPLDKKNYSKLYYMVKTYCEINNIDITATEIVDDKDTKKSKSK